MNTCSPTHPLSLSCTLLANEPASGMTKREMIFFLLICKSCSSGVFCFLCTLLLSPCFKLPYSMTSTSETQQFMYVCVCLCVAAAVYIVLCVNIKWYNWKTVSIVGSISSIRSSHVDAVALDCRWFEMGLMMNFTIGWLCLFVFQVCMHSWLCVRPTMTKKMIDSDSLFWFSVNLTCNFHLRDLQIGDCSEHMHILKCVLKWQWCVELPGAQLRWQWWWMLWKSISKVYQAPLQQTSSHSLLQLCLHHL